METVLTEVQGASDKKAMGDMMLGKEGLAKNFAKGPAAPFMNRDIRRGFYAKAVAGKTIPFRHEFFSYLSKGSIAAVAAATAPPPPPPKAEQSVYKVKMEGLPTDSNPDASSPPHATRLELSCASGTQSLDNYNFPVSKTFSWAPAECGDVTLKIIVGDKTLVREYTGTKQFARFLKDFSDGQHTFYRSDFPDQEGDLKRMGIKFIKVKYAISGGGPVMSLLNPEAPPPAPAGSAVLMSRAPEVIVPCSD
jgi:type VI secretion system protein ImpL